MTFFLFHDYSESSFIMGSHFFGRDYNFLHENDSFASKEKLRFLHSIAYENLLNKRDMNSTLCSRFSTDYLEQNTDRISEAYKRLSLGKNILYVKSAIGNPHFVSIHDFGTFTQISNHVRSPIDRIFGDSLKSVLMEFCLKFSILEIGSL